MADVVPTAITVELSPQDRTLIAEIGRVKYTDIARELQRLYPAPSEAMTPREHAIASAVEALGWALDELGVKK